MSIFVAVRDGDHCSSYSCPVYVTACSDKVDAFLEGVAASYGSSVTVWELHADGDWEEYVKQQPKDKTHGE